MSKISAMWTKRVDGWVASGLTSKQYAAKIGVNHQTLAHWKYRLAREARGRGASAPEFVEVASTPLVGGEAIEIATATGEVVRVFQGFDDETLTRVLDVLAGRR